MPLLGFLWREARFSNRPFALLSEGYPALLAVVDLLPKAMCSLSEENFSFKFALSKAVSFFLCPTLLKLHILAQLIEIFQRRTGC